MNPNMPSWYLSIIRQFSYAALPAIHTTQATTLHKLAFQQIYQFFLPASCPSFFLSVLRDSSFLRCLAGQYPTLDRDTLSARYAQHPIKR